MPVLKIVNGYDNIDAPEKLTDYILRKARFYGGCAVDVNHVAEQIHFVKEAWNAVDGRQMYHFIVSFSDKELYTIDIDDAVELAQSICNYLGKERQIIYGIHLDTDNLHIHFAMNTVSYRDGRRYASNRGNDIKLARFIEQKCEMKITVIYNSV